MARHNSTGSWGEQIASELLTSKGYAILHRNWRSGHYELDIVAMKDSRIVFVEVKTRSSDFLDPTHAIDRKKIMRIIRSADSYINSFNIPHEYQFDIINIIGTQEEYTVEHIPDAFLAPIL